MTRWVAALVLATLSVDGAYAQERPRGGDRRQRHGGPHAPDRVLEMVDAYFVKNLKERLDLTDEQLGRVVPHVRKLQADRRELARRRFRAMFEMRRVLASGGATENEVVELLREVKAVEVEEAATLRRDREAIDGVLTPVQQAKFRLLEVEVERRVRRAMARQGRNRPGAPRDRDDDDGQPPE